MESNKGSRRLRCFGLLRRPSLKKAAAAEASKSTASPDMLHGMLNTYAISTVEKRRQPKSGGVSERLVMLPYFGSYAGQRLTFAVSRKNLMVNIKVRADDRTLTTLYEYVKAENTSTIRDLCIKFTNKVQKEATNNVVAETSPARHHHGEPSTSEPLSLAFLCERKALLHMEELPVHQLPSKYRSFLSASTAQEIRVSVWPSSVVAPEPSSVCLWVKPGVSLTEVQWMICEKLSLRARGYNPSKMALYLPHQLEPIPPDTPLDSRRHRQLSCVLQQPVAEKQSGQSTVVVSVIGHGIGEVVVGPHCSLLEFEESIRSRFHLQQNSFLYMPQLFRSLKGSENSCCLKMSAKLDQSTSKLLSTTKRNFPIIDRMPTLNICDSYSQLQLYRMLLRELDLLKASPVIVFEVTGPTVPLSFKTIRTQQNPHCYPDQQPTSTANVQQDSVFALLAVQQCVVSINPNWTVNTLLRYIECISGFPCDHVRLPGGKRPGLKSLVGEDLTTRWSTIPILNSSTIPELLQEE